LCRLFCNGVIYIYDIKRTGSEVSVSYINLMSNVLHAVLYLPLRCVAFWKAEMGYNVTLFCSWNIKGSCFFCRQSGTVTLTWKKRKKRK